MTQSIQQTQETYERRVATLRRLGAKVVELYCDRCKERFVDPEPLGGRKWQLITMANMNAASSWDRRNGSKRAFCSEACVTDAFSKARGTAWIEGYEP